MQAVGLKIALWNLSGGPLEERRWAEVVKLACDIVLASVALSRFEDGSSLKGRSPEQSGQDNEQSRARDTASVGPVADVLPK